MGDTVATSQQKQLSYKTFSNSQTCDLLDAVCFSKFHLVGYQRSPLGLNQSSRRFY